VKRGPFSLIKILQLMQKKLLLSENFTRIYYFPRPFFLSLKKWKLFNDFSSHLQLSQCVDSEKNRFSNKSVWIFSWLVKLKKGLSLDSNLKLATRHLFSNFERRKMVIFQACPRRFFLLNVKYPSSPSVGFEMRYKFAAHRSGIDVKTFQRNPSLDGWKNIFYYKVNSNYRTTRISSKNHFAQNLFHIQMDSAIFLQVQRA